MIYLFFFLVFKSSQTSGEEIVKKARSKLGCHYKYGASGPNQFDCSGFTQWVHSQFGISIPRTAAEQGKRGVESTGHPGDIALDLLLITLEFILEMVNVFMHQHQVMSLKLPKLNILNHHINSENIIHIKPLIFL